MSRNFLQAGVRRREQQLEEGRFPGQADVHPGLEGGGRRSEVQVRQDCPEVQQRGHLGDLHAVAVLQVGEGYRGLCSGVTKIWNEIFFIQVPNSQTVGSARSGSSNWIHLLARNGPGNQIHLPFSLYSHRHCVSISQSRPVIRS